MNSPVLVAGLCALALTGCDQRAPLTDIERDVWASELPPERNGPLAEPGKPGYPDVERPKVKGRAVLRVIPVGSSEVLAVQALRARAFSASTAIDPGRPTVSWISAEKTWCATFKCCVTSIGIEVSQGQVTNAVAYDYEYGRIFRLPVINSTFGPATCR